MALFQQDRSHRAGTEAERGREMSPAMVAGWNKMKEDGDGEGQHATRTAGTWECAFVVAAGGHKGAIGIGG